ncbi:MAG: NADH-quinone oxidoreductase subunit L [Acidobacteria bacterium]|nr:NADH-quinone oxidoreductase subunit L [Acidobacteriota bacterium]MCA1611137.1 NADH-quinone oxidoreductase subunit L [Acidobacteriota bacterium]
MKDLLWLVPLFPLAGFLVNGVLYLISHRTRGEAADAHGSQGAPALAAAPAPSVHGENPAHTHAGSSAHDPAGHSPIPLKTAHTVVGTVSVGLSCVFAFLAILDVGIGRLSEGAAHVVTLYRWLPLGVNQAVGQVHGPAGEWFVDAAFRLDSLSALMIAFVTFVGFLIHVYSVGYMGHEEGYGRYFAYLNLFMFSMLLLVLGANFLLLFVGWEGVGLCSYLLIGYFYDRDAAADAGKKAFVVNRIGDFGFILGIFGIFSLFGSLDFGKVFPAAAAHPSAYAPYLTLVCLCLFVGACGKSAQFPLYVWLPDAMAGPTPVSALIHAATMVTAGVYMVARCNVLFRLSPDALLVVAVVGGFTALFAATIGVAQNDIKKVLAYSTVSQLGYMFLACGVGAFVAGMFHVMTHAFFKACLFLGSGSVIHALGGEQDIRKMGGLASKIPVTYRTFLVATLAIAGVPLLAGFFSKDAILAAAFEAHFASAPWLGRVLWAAALFTAGLTAFYMLRLVSLTFWGKFRGGTEQEAQIHESPRSMTVPLIVLAFLSVVGGYVGIPMVRGGDRIGEFLHPILLPLAGAGAHTAAHEAAASTEALLMAASVAAAAIGLALAYVWYAKGEGAVPARIAARFPGVYRAVSNKYYVDEAYDSVFVQGLAKGGGRFLWDFDATVVDGAVNGTRHVTVGLSWLSSFFDQYVVDGLVNGVANTLQAGFRGFRRAQTGRVQNYALVMGGGLFCLVAVYLLFR